MNYFSVPSALRVMNTIVILLNGEERCTHPPSPAGLASCVSKRFKDGTVERELLYTFQTICFTRKRVALHVSAHTPVVGFRVSAFESDPPFPVGFASALSSGDGTHKVAKARFWP